MSENRWPIIDPSTYQANVNQAAANLAQAKFRLAQAKWTQRPNDVQVDTQIRQQQAGVDSAVAAVNSSSATDYQVRQNSISQIAAAEATVERCAQ